MGLIQYSGSILLVGLFAIAIISFAIGFADDNNAIIDLEDDSLISNAKTGIQGNLTVYYSDTNESSKAFTESTIAAGSDTFESGGVWKTMTGTLPDTMTNAFSLAYTRVFGGDVSFGIIFTVLASFLTILAVLYGWKAWRGNPD